MQETARRLICEAREPGHGSPASRLAKAVIRQARLARALHMNMATQDLLEREQEAPGTGSGALKR